MEFKYDVALSYASEDRQYVDEVANELRSQGVKVFYDEFMISALWGADLTSYLDRVYRQESRFAVVFLSAHYARKSWTSHERQSAQARALAEKGTYLLPVRLDDAEVSGIAPTVGHLDGRRRSPGELVRILKEKLGQGIGTELSLTEIVESIGVPRTAEAQRQLVEIRPPGWEYLLWAGCMWQRREELEPMYRDHTLSLMKLGLRRLEKDELLDFFKQSLDDLQKIVGQLNRLLADDAQVWALGAPGEPGDPVRIMHYGRGLMHVYEAALEWSASVRAINVPAEALSFIDLVSHFVDMPIQSLRQFVDDFVDATRDIPRRITQGESVNLAYTVTIDFDSELSSRAFEELKSIMGME